MSKQKFSAVIFSANAQVLWIKFGLLTCLYGLFRLTLKFVLLNSIQGKLLYLIL